MQTIIIEDGKFVSSRSYLRDGEALETRGPWAKVDTKFEWLNSRRETGWEQTQGETPVAGWVRLIAGGSPEFPARWARGKEVPWFHPALERRRKADAQISREWERTCGDGDRIINRAILNDAVYNRRIPHRDRQLFCWEVKEAVIYLWTVPAYSLPPEAEPVFRSVAERFGVPLEILPPHDAGRGRPPRGRA